VALTSTQKTNIRQYLGYPNIFRYKHTRLESVMDDLDADAEAVVVTLLADIVTADTQVKTAVGSIAGGAGVKKVDEIEFFSPKEGQLETIESARDRGRELVGRLSNLFGVPVGSDYFGQLGYEGDAFSEGGGMTGRGAYGGPFLLG